MFLGLIIAVLVALSTYPVQSTYAQTAAAPAAPNIVQFNSDLLTFVVAILTCLTLGFTLLTKYIITPVVKKEFEEWGRLHVTKEVWTLENRHIWDAIKGRHSDEPEQ